MCWTILQNSLLNKPKGEDDVFSLLEGFTFDSTRYTWGHQQYDFNLLHLWVLKKIDAEASVPVSNFLVASSSSL